ILEHETPQGSYKFNKPLPEGWHYWRLRARSPHFLSPWTAVSSFRVTYESSPFNFKESDRIQVQRIKEMEMQEKRKHKMERAQRQAAVNPPPPPQPKLATPQVPQPLTRFELHSTVRDNSRWDDL